MNSQVRLSSAFQRLLLTNRVHASIVCSILTGIKSGIEPNAVVVVRGAGEARSRLLILDGNHRAVAASILSRPLKLVELLSDDDRDFILELEAHGLLDHFPHRAFLTGKLVFRELRKSADLAAEEQAMCSAQLMSETLLAKGDIPPNLLIKGARSEGVI